MKKLLSQVIPRTTRMQLWSIAVLASLVIVGFGYTAVQQNYRLTANDPQVQYAEDISTALEQGTSPDALSSGSTVDARKSLAIFLVVVDEHKKTLASSLQVDGKTPVPSDGALQYAKNHGQNKFTWAPASGVRIAAVVQHYGGSNPGYVVVGRSLKEVENREMQLTYYSAATFGLLVVLATMAAASIRPKRIAAAVSAAAQTPLQFEASKGDDAKADPEPEVSSKKSSAAKPAAKKSAKTSAKKSAKKAS